MITWLRQAGCYPFFGFSQEDYHLNYQVLKVWGLFLPLQYEVYRWPFPITKDILDRWMQPLPFGSYDAYQRIKLSADLVYSGHDWDTVRRTLIRL